MSDLRERALQYHEFDANGNRCPGKVSVVSPKACQTQDDLSLAYSPGVAEPVREIAKNPENAYRYTNKGNLVAVISDGTAILGLGNLGPLASKPVMEGKGVLFKRFADVDVFDIEVKAPSMEAFIETVANIAPTFGGINLEDIAAPHCFEIERILKERLDIPVFHDDQHGTAAIMCAGLVNALELQGKKIEEMRLVCLGAGAAGLAGMRLLLKMGAKKENMILVDSKGVIRKDRTDLNKYKQEYATELDIRTLEDAMTGADVFIGVSGKDLLKPEVVKLMAPNPIIFAMANPDPEIRPDLAHSVRDDLIMATGRSDYPNQVNNVLGFPFIFRGALDARAKQITDGMLIACVNALAELAREPVPAEVLTAYKLDKLEFGKEYIIPKPFDPRLLERVAGAVREAALKEGA